MMPVDSWNGQGWHPCFRRLIQIKLFLHLLHFNFVPQNLFPFFLKKISFLFLHWRTAACLQIPVKVHVHIFPTSLINIVYILNKFRTLSSRFEEKMVYSLPVHQRLLYIWGVPGCIYYYIYSAILVYGAFHKSKKKSDTGAWRLTI